jgi:hypothetical protein
VLYAVVVGHLGMEHMKDVTNIPIVSSYELIDPLFNLSLIRILKGRIEGMWADKTNERVMGATLIISSSWF